MSELTLYDRPDCPYSKRVRRVLDVLNVEYEEIIVPESRDERTEVESLTGQQGVPVLADDEHPDGWLADSGEISSYLKENYDTATPTP